MSVVPTPLLDSFKRGDVEREVRLLAAEGALAPRAHEQIAILVLLTEDPEVEVRRAALETIDRIPPETAAAFLARSDVSQEIRDFFAKRGVVPADRPSADPDQPLIDLGLEVQEAPGGRESVSQQIAKMGFSQRLKAAVKGTREMRTLLIRDPNKTVAAAVLSSPKLTEQEVESFARMANLPEDVLRIIANNRQWMRNYGIVVGLTKNPKTPLALSLNMMARLTDRDLQMLSIDRNIPDPLRVAARKKFVAGTSKK
jgi:hypothetical protein